mgnify:FL=1
MFIFASINNAKFNINVDTKFATYKKDFKLDDVSAMARFLKQFKKQTHIATSSSIDFPEEDGAPEGFDAREKLGQAMQLAWS